MKELISSVEFWLAMAFAIVMKLKASPRITIVGAVMTTISAVTCALVFTEPVMAWLELDSAIYTYAVCALIALTGEHLAREILKITIDEAVRAWRGGKK